MATTTKVIRVANPSRRRTGRGKYRARIRTSRRKRNAGRARRRMTEKQIRHFGTKAQKAALKRKYRARFKGSSSSSSSRSSGRGRRRRNSSSSSPRVKVVYRFKTKANRSRRRRTSRRRSPNPALVVTLGSINPKRRKSVARSRKRRRTRRASNARRHHTRRRRSNRTRVVVVSAPRRRRRHASGSRRRHRRHNRRYNRRSRNPLGGGGKQMVMAGVGILAGVAATKYIVNIIPASISSSLGTGGIMAVVISGASAFAAGWVLKKVDPTVGEFALYGGIAQTISVALNQFFPSVGGVLSLGDLVNGNFVVPQNPIRAGMAVPAVAAPAARGMSAYPSAY